MMLGNNIRIARKRMGLTQEELAMQIAEKYGKDKVIATVLADRAERYFSTGLI